MHLPPATDTALNDIEVVLGVALPEVLRQALKTHNGLRDGQRWWILWSAEEILRQNEALRADPEDGLYMPFDHCLFIGPDAYGGGDLVFYPIQSDGKIGRDDLFLWEHETDSRRWLAPNLDTYLKTRTPEP